jgi:hypothetical protein
MLDLANIFILLLAAAAAWLGVSAVVQKRHTQRQRDTAPRGPRP